ncbi:hypothetical protein [Haloarcula litorea]|uniref:hypothetical protein n=1 Tax=Haloarcula litorea TaxID=3032579 RepID=UPI0023E87403|nr:hypothetical protein [Halomicroarcula sp. GDY20]
MPETASRQRDDGDDWAARHGRVRGRPEKRPVVVTDVEDDWKARHAETDRAA